MSHSLACSSPRHRTPLPPLARRCGAAPALLSLLLFLGCGKGGDRHGRDLLAAGREALARGDTERAAALLRKAVSESPRDVKIRLAYALALERGDKIRAAERVLREGLAAQPREARLWGRLGSVLARRGEFDQAVDALDRARRLDPTDPEPSLALGRIYERYQKWETARSHYRAVLAGSYGRAARVTALRRLASLARRENRLQEAIGHLQAALRLAPKRVALLGELGDALRLAGRSAQALPLLRQRVALEPKNGSARLGLGLALRDQADHKRAVSVLRQAARLLPGKVDPLLPLARSLLALGRKEEAYRVGVKGLALAPEDPEMMWLMAPLYADRGLLRSAAALVEKLRPIRSHDADYWVLAGRVSGGLERFAEARRSYARALTLRPRDSRLVRLVGITARRAGDYGAARRLLARVVALDPADYEAGVNLAIAEEQMGKGRAASARLRALARARPRSPQAHLYLGWIALRRGRLSEALRLGRLADRLAEGKSPHAMDVLARALIRSGARVEARKVVARALALPLSAGDRAYFQKLLGQRPLGPGAPGGGAPARRPAKGGHRREPGPREAAPRQASAR